MSGRSVPSTVTGPRGARKVRRVTPEGTASVAVRSVVRRTWSPCMWARAIWKIRVNEKPGASGSDAGAVTW